MVMIKIGDGCKLKENELKLSAPDMIFSRKVSALFKYDPNVKVEYDESEKVIKLYVKGQEKADALATLLPKTVRFGNTEVIINVVPANVRTTKADLYKKAFDGNPVFSYAATVDGVMTNPIHYVIMKPEIAQYYGDSLHDPHGLISELYEDVARDVFGENEGVCFSTDKVESDAVG